MTAKTYGQIVGVVVLLVGIVGLIMGDSDAGLLGFNIDIAEDIVHLVFGALLLYAGFGAAEAQAKSIVMVVAIIWLVVGILGFVDKGLFGLTPTELGVRDNLLHLVLGALGLWAAKAGGAAAAPPTTTPGAPA